MSLFGIYSGQKFVIIFNDDGAVFEMVGLWCYCSVEVFKNAVN